MNQFYERFQQNQNASNPFANRFSLQNAMGNLMNQLNQMGMTPEAKVKQLIQSGQMTQQQFNQLGQLASQYLQNFR